MSLPLPWAGNVKSHINRPGMGQTSISLWYPLYYLHLTAISRSWDTRDASNYAPHNSGDLFIHRFPDKETFPSWPQQTVNPTKQISFESTR
ncbi:hypothetical protein HDV57DRAFT_351156 [Trichoderma longibrachiatum]